MATKLYRPKYEDSWALVIGINDYRYASPLEYARNDAEAVCDLLTHRFNFPEANVILLTDEEATRDKIMVALDALESNVADDDRVLVFFAGHGHTQTGHRREVGFLVPADCVESVGSLKISKIRGVVIPPVILISLRPSESLAV